MPNKNHESLDADLLDQVRELLERRGFWISIPARLKDNFVRWRLRSLRHYVRSYSLPLLFLVYFLAGVSNWLLVRHLVPSDLRLWHHGCTLVCVLLTVTVLLAQTHYIQRNYPVFVMPAAVLVLCKFIVLSQVIGAPLGSLVEGMCCMISIAVVVVALRLRVTQASWVCVISLVLGEAMGISFSAHRSEWPLFLLLYSSMMGFCLFLASIAEDEERLAFLQAILTQHVLQERELLIRELDDMAFHDPLSGLANRREFDRVMAIEVDRMQREHKPLSLLYVDIDHFKNFNDRYGHAQGDECLFAVAAAIRSALLRPADLAARYGGEEFVVLLPDTDASGAMDVAHRVLVGVRQLDYPHAASPTAPQVTVSVGVSTAQPQAGLNADQLVGMADKALYAAKEQGRNRVCFRDGLRWEVWF